MQWLGGQARDSRDKSEWVILGWVSLWTKVRLTHWLHKFLLVWPHQVNDQVNECDSAVCSSLHRTIQGCHLVFFDFLTRTVQIFLPEPWRFLLGPCPRGPHPGDGVVIRRGHEAQLETDRSENEVSNDTNVWQQGWRMQRQRQLRSQQWPTPCQHRRQTLRQYAASDACRRASVTPRSTEIRLRPPRCHCAASSPAVTAGPTRPQWSRPLRLRSPPENTPGR